MQLRTELLLAVCPKDVWNVLADLRGYSQWNPLLTSARGRLEPGARLELTYSFADGGQSRIRPRVTVVRPVEELRWCDRLWLKGLFDLEHFFLLSVEDGGTRLVQGANADGRLVTYMGHRLTHLVRGFVAMNRALQHRLED